MSDIVERLYALMSEIIEQSSRLSSTLNSALCAEAAAEITRLRDQLGETLVRENNLIAKLDAAREAPPSFADHCTALADHDTQGALAGEVPDIGKENARLHAEMDTARKLLREGTNSGSHYFVTSDWTAAVDSFLADAPAPAERGSEWRNIESAPKDQTILVYASPREDLKGFQSTCKWHEDAGFCVDQLREVTHWMPLPPPPAAPEKGGE